MSSATSTQAAAESAQGFRLTYRQSQMAGMWARIIILSIACIFAIFPVLWIVSAAFNPSQSMNSQTIIPEIPAPLEEKAANSGVVSSVVVQNGERVVRSANLILTLDVNGENVEVRAPKDGYIGDLNLKVGDTVAEGDVMFTVGSTILLNFDVLLNTPRFPFFRWIVNSIIVASITSVLTVMLTALAAYSFSRFRFYGRRGLMLTILLVQVFPNLLAMVAIFLILQQLGEHIALLGLNTMGGLILVYVGGAMGVNIWLMKGFFDSVPRDIDESALVDGATHWQTYWMLIFPLVRPILIVVGILSFVGTFNEFVLARVLLRDNESWTLMVGLWGFIADNFAQNWGVFAAGALIGAVPTLVIYLALQDQIVGGLTQGAVKG